MSHISKNRSFHEQKNSITLSIQDIDAITACIGSPCSVLDQKNVCYFDGRISEYDAHRHALKITALRGSIIPTFYNSLVKITAQNGGQITILHGIVKEQCEEFWWIELMNVAQFENQRESFRQRVEGHGTLTRDDDVEGISYPCQLIDISLTGIGIACDAPLQIGEEITIRKAYLYEGAPLPYTFHCTVRRQFYKNDSGPVQEQPEALELSPSTEKAAAFTTYYGCAFPPISPVMESRLFKDIFFLQKRERNL